MRPPEGLRAAPVTYALAALVAAAWLVARLGGLDEAAATGAGFVPVSVGALPGEGVLLPALLTPLTAAFVHSGFIHLAFNLIVLLAVGRSIERVLGGIGLAILWVTGAFAAAAAQYALDPAGTQPLIGAGGALSAVLGAYALLFGRHQVKIAHHGVAVLLHALWVAAAWIAIQLLLGLTYETSGLRYATAAYAGGFVAGVALAKPLLLLKWRGA